MDRDVKLLKEAVKHDLELIVIKMTKQEKDIRNLKLALECLVKEADQEDVNAYIR